MWGASAVCFGTNDSKATNVVVDSFTTYLVPKVPTNAMMFTASRGHLIVPDRGKIHSGAKCLFLSNDKEKCENYRR